VDYPRVPFFRDPLSDFLNILGFQSLKKCTNIRFDGDGNPAALAIQSFALPETSSSCNE